MKFGGDTLSYCSSYSDLICENSWMIDQFPPLFDSVICGVNSGGKLVLVVVENDGEP